MGQDISFEHCIGLVIWDWGTRHIGPVLRDAASLAFHRCFFTLHSYVNLVMYIIVA